jgi:hypothetical protein
MMIIYRAEVRGTSGGLVRFEHFRHKSEAIRRAESYTAFLNKGKTAQVVRLDLGKLDHAAIIKLLNENLCCLSFKSQATIWSHFDIREEVA